MSRRTRKHGGMKFANAHKPSHKARRDTRKRRTQFKNPHLMAQKVQNQLHKLQTRRFRVKNMMNALLTIQKESRAIKKSKVAPMAVSRPSRVTRKPNTYNDRHERNRDRATRESLQALINAEKDPFKILQLKQVLIDLGL